MYKANGAWISSAKLARVLSLLVCASGAYGATVAQWTGSSSSAMWATSSNFSTLYSNLTALGGNGQPLHSVVSVNEITSGTINQSGFLVVSDATRALGTTAGGVNETQSLVNWVQGGGILLLFATPSGTSTSTTVGNQILSALNSASSGSPNISFNGATYGAGYYGGASGPLAGTDPAVAGITGQNLAWYQANGISGGTALSTGFGGNYDLSNYLRVGNFGTGKVYVFGEQFGAQWNVSGFQNGSNLQFFLNLLAQETRYPGTFGGGGPDPFSSDSPEPASIALTGIGLAAVAWMARRRRQDRA
jgi:hypothetical protein